MPREPGSLYKSHATLAADQGWPMPVTEVAGEGRRAANVVVPCTGRMLVQEDAPPRPMVAVCDGCGMAVGVLQPGTPRRELRPPNERAEGPPEGRRRREPRRASSEPDPFLDAT
jgi:hypothetical protein